MAERQTENLESEGEVLDSRRRILRAVFELIGREGLSGISNRRIAAHAGVSLGTLTYHFASQDELLRESLVLFVDEEIERMEEAADRLRDQESGPQEVMAEIGRFARDELSRPERKAELELHLLASRDPKLQATSRRCIEAYRLLAAACLEALGVPEPARHARTVVALIGGLGVQWLGAGSTDPSGLASGLVTVVRGAVAEAADTAAASTSSG